MAWGRLDDSLHDHPKFEHLSLAAVGLWTKCLSKALRQCKTAPVRGFVSEASAKAFANRQLNRLAGELSTPLPGKKFGLWEPVEGGWMIHDFDDYLPKQRDPDEARESGRKGAAAKWAKQGKPVADSHSSSQQTASQQPQLTDGSEPETDMANGMANSGPRASRSAYPSRPVPKDQDQDLGGERTETLQPPDATQHPPDNDPTTSPANARCTRHQGDPDPGPCNGCRAARERAERKAEAAADRIAREHEAARLACTRCDGTWVIDDQQRPTRHKCDHRRSA